VDTIAVNPGAVDILSRSAHIDRVISYGVPGNSWLKIWKLFVITVKGKYDTAIVTITEDPVDAGLALSLAGIRNRSGFSNSANGIYTRCVNWDCQVNETTNHLALLKLNGDGYHITDHELRVTSVEKEWAGSYLENNGVKGHKIIGIHPGSSLKLKAKRWPVQKYREVISYLTGKPGLKVLLFIGPDEQDIAEEMNSIGKNLILARGLTMGKTMGLISRCRVFLSSDSGLMHIAGAMKVPVVAIFGPTDPVKNWGDYRGNIIIMNYDCMPCYAAKKHLACQERKCINNVCPAEVINVLDTYL
ncbi:MAG: glycosyltransferase family 9 protein, partial [Desulfocucumaceae bacterium]